MAVAAKLMHGLSSFVAAPLAVAAYVACLWALGGLGKEQIANALNVPPDEINQLVFGLAMTAVIGSDAPSASSRPQPKLRLVG